VLKKFSPILLLWGLLYLVLHVLGQKTLFVYELLGCLALSVLLAHIVEVLTPIRYIWIPVNIHRVIPMTVAQDIQGVQPMSPPTGLIFSFRSNYKGREE
jgi:hypothetical protein